MKDREFIDALGRFDAVIATAANPEMIWGALRDLANALVGAKLFTVLQVDWQKDVSSRVYSSDPVNYPVSGTKPINRTHWFDIVHKQRRPFIANTIDAIAEVFPDHALIASLGCKSVINLPIRIEDKMMGTINLLHEEGFYTPERVAAAERLSLPGKTAFLANLHLSRS